MNMNDIGVIGLGVMGKNIAINMMNNSFKVAGYNRSYEKTEELIKENHENFTGYKMLKDFVNSLSIPRKVFLMVSAGKAVDAVIDELIPLLSENDIIMDAGNSYFKDTNSREEKLKDLGINYFGVGVSGGEEGALKGPSIMPGGEKEAYPLISDILEAISAKYDGESCCKYIGPKGSGHYVKMVHNGIEYADMQLLAEVYLILKNNGYSNIEISEILDKWNKTEVESYLVFITSKVLKEKDDKTNNDLIDMIVDVAGNKGTGRWTSIEALSQEYNASLLTAAYQARIMSNEIELRKDLSNKISKEQGEKLDVEVLRKAYSLAKSVAFAQGFGLYKDASEKYNWDLDLKEIASIFRAGCIIQARLLQEIMKAYEDGTKNILTLPVFKNQLVENSKDLRKVVLSGVQSGLALPVFTSALTYLDSLSSELLGANIIQAQRDYFGAHTYQRVDRDGFEHHNWSEE
ncbi:MAG: NADP-dependent phosphogluconate dehydrogenase [Erysipelotrichaceae bacterium]|nr:NADP-dependent phosphogluconate dehydrogenase [Erysipelotrichaceae bacterium]